ncbi:MAG TPA: TIGR04053 family radical SAM/SPASM domain-containing protein [Longimicrobiales bacterium]|nr:TIGR04053 family radical SAM/SPASM domain-containing protein [Longimicrobiales bacterium]
MKTHPHGRPAIGTNGGLDFDEAPFVVIWETTQACDLACKHCRAEACPDRNPEELTTDEARALMKRVRDFGKVVFVLSGGDLLKRPDSIELVKYGAELGLRMGVTPATTPLCTPEKIREMKDAGITRLAVSLDGSCPEIHDEFRRVPGSFDWGIKILRECRELGISTQVNTVIGSHNVHDFDNLCALMAELGIVFWEVFFLVPMGRADLSQMPDAHEFERIFNELYRLSKIAPFDIKATAAPQYNRVVLQQKVAEKRAGERGESTDVLTDGAHFSMADGIGRARAVNDGNGFMFISRTGDIFPSGFLPVKAGNVRTDDIVTVYRTHPMFKALRDQTLLKGKCGVCEYRPVCGGSRARAFAVTGDYLEAEPYCAHIPKRWQKLIDEGREEDVETYFRNRLKAEWKKSLPVLAEV